MQNRTAPSRRNWLSEHSSLSQSFLARTMAPMSGGEQQNRDGLERHEVGAEDRVAHCCVDRRPIVGQLGVPKPSIRA
jgi:hypothetical protein